MHPFHPPKNWIFTYRKLGDGPFPVILNLHGGGFAIGDKRDIHILSILKGLEHGYAVVSVNYRLSGEAIFPAGIQDVKAAIRWVRANSGQYHLDGNRIAAWGGSSGGNYAAMICLTDHVSRTRRPFLRKLGISLQRPGSGGLVWTN